MIWWVPAQSVSRGTSYLNFFALLPRPSLNRGYLVQKSFGPGRALFRVPTVNWVRRYSSETLRPHAQVEKCKQRE